LESVGKSIDLSIYLSSYLAIRYLSICVYLSICLSIYLSIHPSIYLYSSKYILRWGTIFFREFISGCLFCIRGAWVLIRKACKRQLILRKETVPAHMFTFP
jgi:hypothetical protein